MTMKTFRELRIGEEFYTKESQPDTHPHTKRTNFTAQTVFGSEIKVKPRAIVYTAAKTVLSF